MGDGAIETLREAADLVSVIREDGSRDPETDPGLEPKAMLRIYRAMVTMRAMDERCMLLQRTGRIGFYVPHSGEEAANVGPAAALRDDDWVFPSYRAQGVLMLRGTDPVEMVDQLFGNRRDLCKGRQMPNHYAFARQRFFSISSPIGTQIVQAVGAAMAARIRGDDTIAATWFGDGSTSSNDFHTGMNFAGVWRAPVVFVCTNNGWAISVPLAAQTASETLALKARAYGMPGVRVDGNDALACYAVMAAAAERARRGDGPTLLEAVTYRMGPHTSSDDPSRYRPVALCEPWRRRDPIERFRRMLEASDLLGSEEALAMAEAANATVRDAIARSERESPPEPDSMFEDVYAETPTPLREQQAELRAELAARGDAGGAEEGHFPL